MKAMLIVLFIVLVFPPSAFSYPKEQLKECMLSAKANPSILGAPESSIKNFCDCALTSIMDDGKDPDSSANKCVKKYFR